MHDHWLDELLTQLGEMSASLIFTLHHEPENDAVGTGRTPADYVAMQRHLLERGVPSCRRSSWPPSSSPRGSMFPPPIRSEVAIRRHLLDQTSRVRDGTGVLFDEFSAWLDHVAHQH